MTLLQLLAFYHLSISNSHATYPCNLLQCYRNCCYVYKMPWGISSAMEGIVHLHALYHQPVSNEDWHLVLLTKPPWNGSKLSSQQRSAEDCEQQFGSLSTVELSTTWGKQCKEWYLPGSWAKSERNLPRGGLRESNIIIHQTRHKTHHKRSSTTSQKWTQGSQINAFDFNTLICLGLIHLKVGSDAPDS